MEVKTPPVLIVPIISQVDALAALAPHSDGLFKMATIPWDEYHTRMPKELLVTFGSRTRASAVHDLMVREAVRYAAKTEGVLPFECKLMKGIVIDGRIAIRFKKLDEESNSKGHYTKQVAEYRSQHTLAGIDATHHLEIGYVLNSDETDISEVRVVCPSGRGVAWWSRIDEQGITATVIDLLPSDSPTPSSRDDGAIIKPKESGIILPIHGRKNES